MPETLTSVTFTAETDSGNPDLIAYLKAHGLDPDFIPEVTLTPLGGEDVEITVSMFARHPLPDSLKERFNA